VGTKSDVDAIVKVVDSGDVDIDAGCASKYVSIMFVGLIKVSISIPCLLHSSDTEATQAR
jgi:hypothetical protein